MIGWMASSKAGHDKGKVYIIIEETEEYVYLSDGEIRPLEKPKKKKVKHIQPIKKMIDKELTKKILAKETVTNEEIKRAIKLYLKEN